MNIKSLWLLVLIVPLAAHAGGPERLLAAAGAGRLEQVRELLAQGVDANQKNAAGRPAIVLSAFNGNDRTLRALLAAGADANAADAARIPRLAPRWS